MSKLKYRPYTNDPLCLALVTKSNAQFLADIQRLFRHKRPTCSFLPPCLAGRPVDLRALYNEVAIRGGHKHVTASRGWSEVYAALGLPQGCVESGHGLRTIYQRYLESFERNQRMASKIFVSDDLESSCLDADSQDADTYSRHVKSTGLDILTCDEIPNHLRETWSLSTDVLDHVECQSLENSLRSRLPNELDFALNSMLLMSSQPNGFALHRNYRLLSLVLSSVGVSESTPHCAQALEFHSYKRFANFWNANVLDAHGRLFLSPGVFCHDLSTVVAPDPHAFRSLFNLHDMSYGDDESFRVQLVATVLRNLAVDGGLSAVSISRDPQALRFIFLCIYLNHSSLRQLGLETLSSLHFPVVGTLVSVLKHLICTLMCSSDRNDRIRGLQLLRRLCESPVYLARNDRCGLGSSSQPQPLLKDRSILVTDRNAEFLTALPATVFHSVVSTLCLRDLHMVVLSLDTLYSLSCLGPTLCDRILFSNSESGPASDSSLAPSFGPFISTIIALLRLEAQSMGSESLVRVRVMQALGSNAAASAKTTSIGSNTRCSSQSLPSTHTQLADPVNCVPSSVTFTPVRSTPVPAFPLSSQPQIQTPVLISTHLEVPKVDISTSGPLSTVHPIRYSIVPPTHPNAGSLSSTHPTTKNASPISTMPRVLPKLAETALSAASFPSPVICASPSSSSSSCKKPRSEPVKLPTAIAPAGPTNSATMQSFSSSSPLVKSSRPLLSADSRTSRPVSLERPSPSDTALNAEATKCSLAPRLDIHLRPALPRSGKLTGDSPVVQVPGSVRRAYMFDWLKRNYAVHNHSSVPRVQIYNDYQHAHQRRFGSSCGNAVSPVDFHSEIKSIFPGVEQVKVQTTHGNVEIHYNNLRCIHSPQPNSEKGVNDIMAAVLSPSKNELPSVRAPKVKLPKRAIGPLHPASTPGSPLGATVAESEPPIPLKLARLLPAHIVNGHLESETDTNNGRKLLPVNGLHKEVIHILNHSTSLAGGLQSITNGPRLSSPDTSGDPIKYKTSSSHCPRLNELVSSETGIVLLPVFTAFNLHAATSIAKRSSPTPDSKVLTETCNLIVSSPSPILRDSYTPGGCTMAVANHCSPSSVLNSAESIKCVPDNSQLDLGCPIDPAPRPSSAETSSDLQMVTTPSPSFLICQWNACGRTFQRIDDVIAHVMDTHITKSNSEEVSCSWMDCSELPTNCSVDTLAVHILTRHLSQSDGSSHPCSSNSNLTCVTSTERRPSSLSDLLQADCILADPSCVSTSVSSLPFTADSPLVNELSGSPEPTLEDSSQSPLFSAPLDPTPVDPVLPGSAYPPSTTSPVGVALPSSSSCTVKLSSECRRALANSAPNHPFVSPPTREGPVTKHIRLTAALVLKNLVRYSPTARRYVAKWEELICDLAFSDLESSPTLFECLSYLDNGGGLLGSPDRHFFSLSMVPTVDFTRCTSSFSS